MNHLPLFLAAVVFVITAAHASPFPSHVEVTVRKVGKRSLQEGSSVSLKIEGPGHSYNLNLASPSASIFTENFKFIRAGEDASGANVFVDDTPSAESLREIEEQIYIEKESDAAVSVRGNENSYEVHGVVDGLAILPSQAIPGKYQVSEVRASSEVNDYIDLHRNITPARFSSRAATVAQPEVWVVFDYDNSQTFGQDRTKILDYLGVFFHAINNRYATFSDPSISFRISGVTVMSSRSSQPFMENNKVPDGSGNDINKVLEDFSKWSFANQASGPKFDLAAVISGVDFQSKDSSGVYSTGVAGLAYLSAACWKTTDRWYATSVTEDRGGYYDGVWSVAHEFAHNLGSPHDGSGDSTSCSWEDGYIMSYKGWGTTNKFYFSSCSINLMRNYIASTQGSCVKSLQSSTNIPVSNDNVGDRYDMTALCVKYTKQSSAVPEPTKTADDLCKNLACRYPTPGKPAGYYSIVTLNHPPGDNTPCGTSGGRCTNGVCVAPSG